MWFSKMAGTYVVVLSLAALCTCYGQTYVDEIRLVGYLFEPDRYDKTVRPVINRSTTLQVNISHEIRSITHVDVSSGTFCTYSSLGVSWSDELLTWEPIEYGGIQSIALPEGKYWTPDFEKQFPGTCGGISEYENFEIKNATLLYDGRILVSVYKPLGSICGIDMTYYPLDEHVCYHQFYSTKYNHEELSINLLHDRIIGPLYVENQEWKVTKTDTIVADITVRQMSFTYASNSLAIVRRPGFIIINKFLPTLLLLSLHSFLPLIPPNSERLSFAITNYLALSFMTISFVADMPRNSVNTTVFSYWLLCFNIAAAVGVLWSVCIVRLANFSKSTRKIPKWLLNRLGRKSNERALQSAEEGDETKEAELKTDDDEHVVGWYEVAMFLDEVYIVTSMFIVVGSLAIICIWFAFYKE